MVDYDYCQNEYFKMSKAKKLTQDEKRVRLLEYFHETKSVFVLKELEKMASKEKSIPSQTIKDTLNSLIDDNLVETDKIGASTYFWSFPSQTYQKKLCECNNLEQSIKSLQEQSKNLDDELSKYIANANDDQMINEQNNLKEMQENVQKLEQEKQKLLIKLDKLKNYRPNELKRFNDDCQLARTAIERWTDNIFQLRSWSKKRFQMESSEIDKVFAIPSDFDYYNE